MIKQRSNNDVKKREYAGEFVGASMGKDVKHSLDVSVKVDGTICLAINHPTIKGTQGFQGIMLTNEQRKDLAAYLSESDPKLWQDIKIDEG